MGRVKRFTTLFRLTREVDRKMPLLVVGAFLAPIVVLVIIALIVGHWWLLMPLAILTGVLAGIRTFGTRVQNAQYVQLEGQVGAAWSVVSQMRGDWRIEDQPSAVTKQQDVVFRVLGRPGVVLIGEGNPTRLAALISTEKKRLGRVTGEVPIYDLVIGDGDGQVPLRKLQSHLIKLPRNCKQSEINAVERRLRALPGAGLPIPKGPLPKSAKMPRGPVR